MGVVLKQAYVVANMGGFKTTGKVVVALVMFTAGTLETLETLLCLEIK